MPSDEVVSIPDDLFKKPKIDIATLDNINTESSVIPKGHYYFLLNDNYLIVGSLPLSTDIKRFQVYMNWLLEEVREDNLFEFSPIIEDQKSFELKDIKSITFGNSKSVGASSSNQNEYITKIRNVGLSALLSILNDTPDLDTALLEEVVSAKIILKIEKPSKKNTTEDIKKTLSAVLKPISDTENVTFETKKGARITGKDLQKTRKVEIETTETGKISQNQLFQEMEKLLGELSINNES